MRIYFLPELCGPAYLVPTDGNPVMMDTMATGLSGLVSMLELRLGLHVEDMPQQDRLVLYYDAMRRYIDCNGDSILAQSFKASGLGTAKEVLEWRDQLLMAGWQFGDNESHRLTAISDIEEYLDGSFGKTGMSERIAAILTRKPDCHDISLVLPCEPNLFKPTVRRLIEVMLASGATCEIMPQAELPDNNLSKVRSLISLGSKDKITLDPKDGSFQIWKFADEHTANEYLAQYDDDSFDLWINSDNKQMDNWLALMGKPQTGSTMANCSPQLTQLFVTGISLHAATLNVKTLIEWLNMPVHPIDRYFRSILADTVARTGGFRNDECRKTVQEYIDGVYVFLTDEQKSLPEDQIQAIREKDRKKRISLAKNFLPSLDRQDLSAATLMQFSKELASWAKQRAHLMAVQGESPLWIEQLLHVAAMSMSFNTLLTLNGDKTISDSVIDNWLNAILGQSDYVHAEAAKGCRSVIDSPYKMLSVAGKAIWMGVEGDNSHHMECSFLFPTEKSALEKRGNFTPWSEENQNAYYKILAERAFAATSDQLVLSYCERRGGEPIAKHPYMVLLENKVKNLADFIKTPDIEPEKMAEVHPVINITVDTEQEFDHAEMIKWPDHLSPTKVGTLVEYPFDFLMSELLGIVSDCQVQMSDTRKTEGNVAHAVIEALFAPRGDERVSTPVQISGRIDSEFDSVFDKTIESKGAIFLLKENKLAAKLLKKQLKESVSVLSDIIRDNGLNVTACERYVEEHLGLGLNSDTEKRDMLGFIDMTLEDKDRHPVVFDFKWSKSKYYPGLLEKNRSVQLELYRHMLGAVEHDAVERTAYYLMPQNRLFSKEHFEGSRCHQVTPANNDEIVGQICRSIAYRKNQIDSGVVESGLASTANELEYGRDTEKEYLFPLEFDNDGNKLENRFTDYGIFI